MVLKNKNWLKKYLAKAPGEADDDTGEDDAGGMDDGGLFAADQVHGNILDGQPISPSDQYNEADDYDDEDSDDEIDLENISADFIKPKGSKKDKNMWGEDLIKKRDRSVKRGSLETGMPDFLSMTSTGKAGRPQDTLNDPYDTDFLKNPFKKAFNESRISLADLILGEKQEADDNYSGYRPALDKSMQLTLEKMRFSFGKRTILKENNEKEIELGFDLEEEDDG
jgi:hypothetical protein